MIFTVSRVFDHDEDENEEEHTESLSVINALTQQLDENDNCMLNVDLELEKEKIYDELSAIFDEKFALAKASYGELEENFHETEAEVKRLKDELFWSEGELEKLTTQLNVLEADMERTDESLDFAEKSYQEQLDTLRKEIQTQQEHITAMTEAHAAEIKRFIEVQEEILKIALENEPPLKRKQVSTSPQLTTASTNTTMFAGIAEAEIECAAVVGVQDADEMEKKHENGEPTKI